MYHWRKSHSTVVYNLIKIIQSNYQNQYKDKDKVRRILN